MKKILLFASIFSFAALQAQNVSINKLGETTDVSGTEILLVNTSGNEEIIDLEVKNESANDLTLKVTRLRIDVPSSGWSDYVCWQYGAAGLCYTANAANPWTTGAAITIPAGAHGSLINHIDPDNSQVAYAHYRYYILNTNTQEFEDSVDVKINPILTVKENKQNSTIISVFPNPADNFLTISIPTGAEGYVKLTDVLGKMIYDERLSSSKKLDVSTFKNGVYVAVINVNGTSYTKRFVVKH